MYDWEWEEYLLFVKSLVREEIFYPKDRTGYQTKEAMEAEHKACQEQALLSYPGAKGDLLVAMSMTVCQLNSVIEGAKERKRVMVVKINALPPYKATPLMEKSK